MSQGGGGKGALPVEDTVKTQLQQVEGPSMVRMAAEMLDCHACHLPLKHPIFECDADHLMCSSCRGVHGEACGRPVAHSTLAEAFAAAAFVPCDYKSYGCVPGHVVYHKADDHRLTCQYVPCGCPEHCGFSGSRQELLKHISGDHSRTIVVVRYGQPGALSLPLSLPWHLIVGEEDRADQHRNMFLVSAGDRDAEVEVSLVCIRADGGVPPQFSCKIAVEHSDGTKQILESPVMKSSSLSSGTPAAGEVKCLTLKKEYLSSDIIPLSIRIDRLAHPSPFTPTPSPFSPKSPPFSPTRPFSPKSPPFSPTRPFSPKPNPKHPFSPKPSSGASPPPPAAEGKIYKRTRKAN